MKTSKQIREDFINYWKSSPRNCVELPNVSLVPNVDSTLLFVNSGMFPLATYLGGQPHPLGTRLVNFQRCLRTNYDEMIEIGDNRHTLMFEMMGDWSLGDFFKAEQIPWILDFWVEVCGLDPKRIYVSVFEGDSDAPIDLEAIEIWQKAFKKYGIDAKLSDSINNVPPVDLPENETWEYRIFKYPKKKNWWERAHAPNELGGPTSEMFYDRKVIDVKQNNYHINDDSGRFIEIGNNVFMQYKLDNNLKWQPLPQKNIDFGGGFERLVMLIQNKNDIFETDIYYPLIQKIEELSKKEYKTNSLDNQYTASFRVIADHARAATFILADGIAPSNKDQGYILRRFIRRLVRFGKKVGIENNFTDQIAQVVINTMSYAYPHLQENQNKILELISKEEIIFKQTLDKGLRHLQKLIQDVDFNAQKFKITGKIAFDLYETFGFPLELTLDELNLSEEDALKITSEFKVEEKNHREASRAGAEQKFKGGLADSSNETTRLHTAHHLLLKALQKIVDPTIKQRGSNITAERLRIDFNLNRKLTEQEIVKVEDFVNNAIEQNLRVDRLDLNIEDAEKLPNVQKEFGIKYPNKVSVYIIGLNEDPSKFTQFNVGNFANAISIEFCGGPHVKTTKEIVSAKSKFKILKEESSGNGIRRIKATII